MVDQLTASAQATARHATESRFEALYELMARLSGQPGLSSALDEVLAAAVELVGADAGYIRLFDPKDIDPDLSQYPFVAHVGLSDAYIDYFSSLPGPVAREERRELFLGRRVMIPDMTKHPSFAPHLEVVLAEGYRALQGTPLMSPNASRSVGVIGAYFFEPGKPPDAVNETLDMYAELAANAIEQHRQIAALAERDAAWTAVVDKQVGVLKHFQDRAQSLEEEALSLDPEDIRLVTHALRVELERAIADAAAAGGAGSKHQAATELKAYPYGLTSRELEVLVNAWRGLPDKQIAKTMGISRYTVAKHISAGMRKMNVETRTQASVLFEREALHKRLVGP